ncbi:fumarylacetoacetate hydrolase family protein [Paenibacillus kandeliae]|uniref:fumarylacetoacetate hydrolase family protein n=1 Tax=Paenibacillus kandeliae TaxID=3231269 RepID=UPI00345A1A41
MKYVHYEWNGQAEIGIRLEKGILSLPSLARYSHQPLPQRMEELLSASNLHTDIQKILDTHGSELETELLDESMLRFLPCIPQPGKVICIGLNYRKHAAETNMPEPETPVVFSKFSDTVAAHGDDVPIPEASTQVDYEAELCIVIGREVRNVSREDALDYVFGYCAANDVSARDLQMRTSQWLLGKTCERFAPIGPYLVTADEVGDPNHLTIAARRNGGVVQQSNTSDMIFHCDEIIHYLSRHMTLQPGDLILTGTPEGVILGQPPEQQHWLTAGDTVTIEIEKLGQLTNTFV